MTVVSVPSTEDRVTADTEVGNWLLPESGDARVRLEPVVTQAKIADEPRARPLRTLGVVARQALAQEIEAKLRMILGETIADLVVGGWRDYSAVTQAISKSRSQPGVDQIVPLREHTISAARQYTLDVEVDGFPVMTLVAELRVRVRMFGAVAVARDGLLVRVRSGQAGADGNVAVEGVEIAQRTVTVPLVAELAMRASGAPSPYRP